MKQQLFQERNLSSTNIYAYDELQNGRNGTPQINLSEITLNTLTLSKSRCALETPFTVWQQTIDKFAIRMLCQLREDYYV